MVCVPTISTLIYSIAFLRQIKAPVSEIVHVFSQMSPTSGKAILTPQKGFVFTKEYCLSHEDPRKCEK